jgi:hypothetical protein
MSQCRTGRFFWLNSLKQEQGTVRAEHVTVCYISVVQAIVDSVTLPGWPFFSG